MKAPRKFSLQSVEGIMVKARLGPLLGSFSATQLVRAEFRAVVNTWHLQSSPRTFWLCIINKINTFWPSSKLDTSATVGLFDVEIRLFKKVSNYVTT